VRGSEWLDGCWKPGEDIEAAIASTEDAKVLEALYVIREAEARGVQLDFCFLESK